MNPCAAVSTVSSPPFSRTKTARRARARVGDDHARQLQRSADARRAVGRAGTRGKEDKGVQCRSVEDVQSVMVEL